MQTREELIRGLHYVKSQIAKIMQVQKEQVGIVSQYRQEAAAIPTEGIKNQTRLAIVIICATTILFHLVFGLLTGEFFSFILFLFTCGMALWTWKKNKKWKKLWVFLAVADGIYPFLAFMGEVSFWFMVIPLAIVAFVGVMFVIRKNNQHVEKKNTAISQQNSELQAQYDRTAQQLAALKKELFGKTSSWYPKSYYSLNAVEFFINAVENYRADSVKEMVNLFETTQEQKQMAKMQAEINSSLKQQILNQEQINRQLKYANVLNLANLFMQADISASIEANTYAVMDNTDVAKNIRNRLGG